MLVKLTRLLKESSLYALNALALPFVGIIMVPIFTRIFSPDEYGVVDLIATVMAFLTLFLIAGLDNGIGRYYYDSTSVEDRKKTVSSGIFYLAISSLVVIIILMLFSGGLSLIFFGSKEYSLILVLALACVPFIVLCSSFANLLRFRLQPVRAVTIALGTLLLQTGLIVCFVVFLRMGIIGIYVATLITQLAFAIVGFLLTRDSYAVVFVPERLKQMLFFGLPYLLLSVCYYVMTNSDRYFLNYYWGLSEVGVYGIGYKLASVIGIAVAGFQFAWGPFVLSTYKDEDAKQTFARVFDYVSVAVCVSLLGLSLFSRELLYVFTTEQYFEAYRVVPFISASIVTYTLGAYFSVGIGITKKTIHMAWVSIVAALVNLLLNWLLIPHFGMVGAAASTVISFLILAISLMVISQRLYSVPYRFGANGTMYFVTVLIIAVVYIVLMKDMSWLNVGVKVLLVLGFLLVPFALKLVGTAEVRYLYSLVVRSRTE